MARVPEHPPICAVESAAAVMKAVIKKLGYDEDKS